MLFVTESGGHWYRRLFAPRETRQIDRDIGRIEAIDTEAHTILVRYEDRRVRYETTELDELTLAYAVSVHKSQGSDFPAVIVPVLTQHYLLLQRAAGPAGRPVRSDYPGDPLLRASAMMLVTVRQFRLVAATPSSFSMLAVSLDLPMPSGACR
jgi:hypothetical protein